MNKHTFNDYLQRKMKDPKFRKEYENERNKLGLGYQIFLAREKAGMTQQELAQKIGTRQANISRLEQGNYNFTVEMLEKIANALGAQLRINFSTDIQKAA